MSDIDRRLASIKEGKIKENVLGWIIVSDGSEQERNFLNAAKKNHMKYIQKYDSGSRPDYNELFKLAKATGFMWVVYLVVSIAVFCFYFGFRLWYSKVQKLNDDSIKHDIEIKNLTIKKMKQEIALTKKLRGTRYRAPLN